MPAAQRGFENPRGHAAGPGDRSRDRMPERRREGQAACPKGFSNPQWESGSGEKSTKQNPNFIHIFLNLTHYQLPQTITIWKHQEKIGTKNPPIKIEISNHLLLSRPPKSQRGFKILYIEDFRGLQNKRGFEISFVYRRNLCPKIKSVCKKPDCQDFKS